MKQYFRTIVCLMTANAMLARPVLGSQQKKLRGGNPLMKEDDGVSTPITDNHAGATPRHHRVLARDHRGKPTIVEGKLGKLKNGGKEKR
jgi:hypothetical protein